MFFPAFLKSPAVVKNKDKKGHRQDRRRRKWRPVAIVWLLSMVYEMAFPMVSYALTSGPANPEFSSFEPVVTTNMVNEFTGQFVYNIPVLEIPGASGGGYALSLSYHSGDGPESEASWVGYGWTLNPGSINRNKRGIPDDYKNDKIKYYNDVPKNWTVAVTGNLGGQAFSIGGSINNTIRYNNYKGFGYTTGVGLSLLNGTFSLGYYITDGNGTFSVAVSPASILHTVNSFSKKNSKESGSVANRETSKGMTATPGQSMRRSVSSFMARTSAAGASSYINYLLTDMTSPYNLTPYTGKSLSGSVSITGNPPPFPLGVTVGLTGSYSEQRNVAEREVPAFGYMYAAEAPKNDKSSTESIMDYTVDRPSPYNKRDKYLPVPFSTPDAFFVSGEGLGGSFRMYNDKIGIFSPNYTRSEMSTDIFGLDLHPVVLDVGVGGEGLTEGWQRMTVKSSWTEGNGNTDNYRFERYDSTGNDVAEPLFFRFNNDLGGKLVYGDDAPIETNITGKKPFLPGSLELQRGMFVPHTLRKSARASYIGFHTNKEIKQLTTGSKRALAYEQRESIHQLAGRTALGTQYDHHIGEISVHNEDGNNYLYGLPVYATEEKNMQHVLLGVQSSYQNQYWLRGDISGKHKVGEVYQSPYITSYLLTQITTPDYIDINLNGPDEADFGGYTKFSYDRIYGSDNKSNKSQMYKWRAPYTGLYYQPMRLSNKEDNMGAYQSGYKEVYYLDTIETKTHFAKFITEERYDCMQANTDDVAAAAGQKGAGRVKKLKEIQLYAKTKNPSQPHLLKKVHFEYDYSIWPGTENNMNHPGESDGRLTLKKVWFEYNGVIGARVSPYQFHYAYPSPATVTYPARYGELLSYGNNTFQFPMYEDPDSYKDGRYIDCWGNYMDEGYTRRHNLQSWVSQVPSPEFDPAAWQLKRIVLPSGGEIHVQYEQHTYAYVQDRSATAMVSLKPVGSIATGNKFYLNTGDLDISPAEESRLRDRIQQEYINKGQKIYFKFLYTLLGNSTVNVGACNGDYIEGYASVSSTGIDGNGVYVVLGGGVPYQVCMDFLQSNAGKLFDGNCYPVGTQVSDPGPSQGGLETLLRQLWNATMASFLPGQTGCKAVNPQYSYLRIPIWNKKGGGIRVKRLLMYNKGVDVNTPALYGTEYIYDHDVNGESFGVATNEPFENKEENPLVNFLEKRGSQSDWDRLIAGKDKEQFEGPLAMSALPGPSIGYSRVIKKNIHQDKYTGTGFSVIDFYTARDFPFDRNYGNNKGENFSNIKTDGSNWDMDIGLFRYTITTGLQTTQGYSFIQNQMHGQLKSTATYPGSYIPHLFYNQNYPTAPVEQTTYSYFSPGSAIPMYNYNTYSIYYDVPGREQDVTIDRRSVREESKETRITGDITVGFLWPLVIPFPIGFPITSESDNYINALVTNKTTHYPAILKSIIHMKEGHVRQTDHVAFDPLTTRPVVTRTYDAHHGLYLEGSQDPHVGTYYTYNIPASSQYEGMGQKAWNEHYCYYANPAINPSGSSTELYLSLPTNTPFRAGDMVALHHATGVAIGHVLSFSSAGSLQVVPSVRYNATLPVSAPIRKIEIVKSGYTNQLSPSSGGFVEYGNMSENLLLITLNNMLNALIAHPVDSTITLSIEPFDIVLGRTSNDDCGKDDQRIKTIIMSRTGNEYPIQFIGDAYSTSGVILPYSITAIGDTAIIPPAGFQFIPYIYGSWTVLALMDQFNDGTWTTATWKTDDLGPCDNEVLAKGIIRASVKKYRDSFLLVHPYVLPSGYNVYESGLAGKWRESENYVYRKEAQPGSSTSNNERNYRNAGVARIVLSQWKKVNLLFPELWIQTDTVTYYTPHGDMVEQRDAVKNYSAAKYGYNGILPYAVVKNSRYDAFRFESFENTYGNFVEDGVSVNPARITEERQHTGRAAYILRDKEVISFADVGPSTDYQGATTSGHMLRFWIFEGSKTAPVHVSVNSNPLPVTYMARTGQWSLYYVRGLTGTTSPVTYNILNSSGDELIIDDIKIQPSESEAVSYVYDTRTHKLSAVLGDTHFAVIYQYDGEGKLVRKLLETERGVQVVEDIHYNTPKIPRP